MTGFANLSLQGIRAVMLDLDNTLYAYEPAHRTALHACWTRFAAHYPGTLEEAAFHALYRQYRSAVTQRLAPQGCCRSRLLAFQGLFETLGLGWRPAYDFAEQYWASFIAAMTPTRGASAFLGQCQAASIPICLVSDMESGIQMRKLERLNMAASIDFLVTSEEAGAEKPHPAIFARAWEKLSAHLPGLEKNACLMIGDDTKKDIEGARSFGIQAYQIAPA